MGKKGIIFLIAFVVVAVGTPFFIARHLHLGDYATSPQSVELSAGTSVLVAGGRVKLWFACGETGREFEVVCKDESLYAGGFNDEPVAELCGVTVELIEVEELENRPPRGKFRITWGK